MSDFKQYIYIDEKIKLILDEDDKDAGWYLFVYDNPKSNIATADYLQDSEELAFKFAEKKFGIKKSQWKRIK